MGRKGLLFSASKNVLGLVILRVNLVIPQNTRIELPKDLIIALLAIYTIVSKIKINTEKTTAL